MYSLKVGYPTIAVPPLCMRAEGDKLVGKLVELVSKAYPG